MSSPHIAQAPSVGHIMTRVLLALTPAIAVYVYVFGTAILISLAIATLTAVLAESFMLRLRRYPVSPFLRDGSAVVTAWLLALALPPLAPWWLIVIGVAFALIVAKHLYGGLGNNLFNPAMVGFAVLMISFPAYMNHWPAPAALAQAHLSFGGELRYIFSGALPPGIHLDAINMATPLDTLRTELHRQLTVGEIMKLPIYTAIGGKGSILVAFATLLGGLYLLFARIISWHVPVAFLGGLFLIASAFYTGDPSRFAAPWFHLMAGGAILGAFFIATDPVSGATTPRGKLIFGLGVGLLTYIIRALGGYPDGVAFAVLLMNAAVPLIDAYTQPPVFGQKRDTP